MAASDIEWTNVTWNPVTGCNKVSPGCKHCYAEVMARRLKAMGVPAYQNGFKVTLQPAKLDAPLSWTKSKLVFVNSMADLFHKDVPIDYIQDVFKVMEMASWHHFQVLTKRAERLEELAPTLNWPENIWMGVSVENEHYLHRVDLLRKTNAKIKFLSLEPLLGPLTNLNLQGIDWVIVGGESGPGARPMNPDWVHEIKNICAQFNVPFFFKQWGGVRKSTTGRLLEGRTWDAMPYFENGVRP